MSKEFLVILPSLRSARSFLLWQTLSLFENMTNGTLSKIWPVLPKVNVVHKKQRPFITLLGSGALISRL